MKLTSSHAHASFHLRSLSFALVGLSLGGCVGADESTDEPTQNEAVDEAAQEVTNGNLNVPVDMARATIQISGGGYGCTAIRVGARMLVTAAHCVTYNGSRTLRYGYDTAGVNTFGFSVDAFWPVQLSLGGTLKALAPHVHPAWNWNLGNDPDIALIEIDPTSPGLANFDNYVTQRKMNIGYNPYPGRSLILGGWGYTTGVKAGALNELHFGPTSVDSVPGDYIKVLGPLLDASHAGMASGDSGGPLYDNEGGASGTWGSLVAINSTYDYYSLLPQWPAYSSQHTRLDAWRVRDWLMGFASKLNIEGKGKIRGYIDAVTFSGTTRIVRGWACDYGVAQSIDVHVYGNGGIIAGGRADRTNEAAVSNLCGDGTVGHRFSLPLSAADAGKSVYVYGISKSGNWNLPLDHSGWFTVP